MKSAIASFLIFVLSCSSVQAEKLLVVIGEWAPYTSEHLEGYGMMTEIVSAVFQDMGHELEIRFYPWPRCLHLVKRGKAWATFPYLKTESRTRRILFSDPLGESTMKLFHYKSTKEYSFENWEDLRRYKLGGISGYFYEDAFETAGLAANYSIDTFSGLRKLHSGRIELLAEDELAGWQAIKMNFPDEVQHFGTVEKPLYRGPLYLLISQHLPGAEELLDEFNSSLQHIKENGTYGMIIDKYQKAFAVE